MISALPDIAGLRGRRELPRAPRPDRYVRLSRIRLPPRVATAVSCRMRANALCHAYLALSPARAARQTKSPAERAGPEKRQENEMNSYPVSTRGPKQGRLVAGPSADTIHCSWRAYKEILQNVIVLGGGQLLPADPAIQHPMGCARLRFHPNDFVTRLAARAREVLGMVAAHLSNMPRNAK